MTEPLPREGAEEPRREEPSHLRKTHQGMLHRRVPTMGLREAEMIFNLFQGLEDRLGWVPERRGFGPMMHATWLRRGASLSVGAHCCQRGGFSKPNNSCPTDYGEAKRLVKL